MGGVGCDGTRTGDSTFNIRRGGPQRKKETSVVLVDVSLDPPEKGKNFKDYNSLELR